MIHSQNYKMRVVKNCSSPKSYTLKPINYNFDLNTFDQNGPDFAKMKYQMRTNEFFVKPNDCEYKKCEIVRSSDNKVHNKQL